MNNKMNAAAGNAATAPREKGGFTLKKVLNGVARFWDSGTVSIDALYAYKNDASHFIGQFGSYDYASATGSANGVHRVIPVHERDESTEGRVEQILGSEDRFGGQISEPISVHTARRKAG